MLAVGDRIPDVRLWMGPQEQVSLRELAAEKPLLLVFYLFDWSKSQWERTAKPPPLGVSGLDVARG